MSYNNNLKHTAQSGTSIKVYYTWLEVLRPLGIYVPDHTVPIQEDRNLHTNCSVFWFTVQHFLSHTHYTTLDHGLVWLWNGKDTNKALVAYLEVLSQHLLGQSKEHHQDGSSVESHSKPEPTKYKQPQSNILYIFENSATVNGIRSNHNKKLVW